MYKNLKTPAVECLHGEWKLPCVHFFLQNNIFKIDQLIAENTKSSKQTFHLSHVTITSIATHIATSIATRWGGSQIKSTADQDCLAPYAGAYFTEYQWRRCRTMIGEKPKRPDCILCVFKAYSARKKNISTSHH